jgi:hypothetical protein
MGRHGRVRHSLGEGGGRPSLVNEGGFSDGGTSLLARSHLLEANNSKTCDSALRLPRIP